MQHITSEDFHFRNTAVALGKFEGVHLGHQLLLDKITRKTRSFYTSVVFTFDRNPAQFFSGAEHFRQICTREERKKILEERGIDVLIEYPFTREFAGMTPDKFVKRILVGKLGARVIVVGTDFRFGKDRQGDVDTLRYLAEDCDYELVVMDKLKNEGEDVSSTRIRQALEQGRMEEASELLGRPYSIEGTVIHGKALGRKLGIPSANLSLDKDKYIPPHGVYVTTTMIDGVPVAGVTNIGCRPTVDMSGGENVETHFLDYEGDLYGKELWIDFLHYLRPEQKFDSVEILKEQMEKDTGAAREYISRQEGL